MESMERLLGEPAVWVTVNSLITVVAAVICGMFLREAAEATNTLKRRLPPNDNKSAEDWFLRMLSRTRREVVMYDDGDPGTLYDSPEVVEAIKKKVRELPHFKVRCMLNFGSGKTLFEREFADENRVKIYSRKGSRERRHYKLFDNRAAYVSHHARGHNARRRFVLYCRKTARPGKHPVALRRYFRDFDTHAAA